MDINDILEDSELMSSITNVAKESTLLHRWMYTLPDHLLAEIYLDLKQGSTFVEIIDKVQKDWRLLFDINPKLMMSDLANFKMKALNDVALVEAQARTGEPGAVAIKERLHTLSSRIDAMGRLGWLADVQTERIEEFVELEKEEGKPLAILNDTIRQLSSILDKYIRLENEMGVSRITLTASSPTSNMFAFETQDDTSKIVSATRKLLALTEERGLVNVKDVPIDIPVSTPSEQKVIVNE